MTNVIVENQTKQVELYLREVIDILTEYANNHTIGAIHDEAPQGDIVYYKELLATVRRLLVYCEEGSDACKVVIMSVPFRKQAAERILYKIYHQVIAEFFSPKNDCWFENSRSAYTGKNAIAFPRQAPPSIQLLLKKLEGKFQHLREELDYYETDYQTKITQSK
ncbi:DUF3907 family protein [Ectobacillus antri]|jgi:hypothetical protein|uniref:DUF3907 family protein n=1 Tax=Ectobacillus antri TaxID=2486280 RepID=A0ABT6H176_9BACI|nr:DUF3907 family protein [Ectobacillus antri]MDG4656050.1 DUF3907 family protein [Ectobacillus antri]MDG5752725.1 DUF3907 family protein [Ectobacillus antri]